MSISDVHIATAGNDVVLRYANMALKTQVEKLLIIYQNKPSCFIDDLVFLLFMKPQKEETEETINCYLVLSCLIKGKS
ncbi:hypothetical protein [Lysinibacillus fusiformis]|uniref:hypothetical protein n=1 Tax=Lysinibacillus fusiformis TaxID=28031 RepID=UPI003D013F79